MTASMPEDIPRPEKPEIKKNWHYKKGMIIVLEGKNVFPYMQEFSKKMFSQFALELNGFFLPFDKKRERDLIIKGAKKYIEKGGDNVSLTLDFNNPIYVDSLFYKTGLPLPVKDVKLFNIDKNTGLIKNMLISEGKDRAVNYELKVEYDNRDGQYLIRYMNLSTDDDSLRAEFNTEFSKIDGYYLPAKQTRVVEGKNIPEEQKNITVEFTNYLLNKRIPERIYKNER